MMKSLVGYGVSSDSDSDGNEDGGSEPRSRAAGRNFLRDCRSASSDLEERDAAVEPAEAHRWPNKLPPPPLGAGGSLGGSSVFANPFKEQAQERLDVLQRHVPLTLRARPTEIGGRKICRAYRRDGRCRFGSRCKYAHDSDLQGTAAAPDGAPETDVGPSSPAQADSGSRENQERCVQESKGGRTKKRRVGLNDGLTPPKRAVRQYALEREKEQMAQS
ncbi:uncharacterized protein LOC114789035 [Denticeps clupeoides]|uniref:uncharacterized protein LOC114789035 n=1 Tax=Denticeps clupeoides TaxID=299321 RepID=UPI0010A2DD51|nr:uncharacterized protein LOC114789035 [Denticeps clupeoides]